MKYGALIVIILALLAPQKLRAEMGPKSKAVVSTALYGAGGGLLLGFASLAFYRRPRNVAQGASLGLYAGILFGSYVVTSHKLKMRGGSGMGSGNYYPDSQSIYEQDGGRYRGVGPGGSVPFYLDIILLEF